MYGSQSSLAGTVTGRQIPRCMAALLWLVLLILLTLHGFADDRIPELYEPPDGAIYHGAASTPQVVQGYLNALGDSSIEPLIEGIHLGASGTAGRQYVVDTVTEWLAYVRAAGRIPHLSLSMTDGHGNPSDVEIATSSKHDAVLGEIAAVVAAYDDPLFVRFGFEFNGAWNGYTAGIYPIAYRKMVDIFRSAGVTKAAYIWCYEPDAPDDFDAFVNGRPAWYPGDDYVDWFGLDLFKSEHFVLPSSERGQANALYTRSVRFLDMAALHGKPVMLSETAAAKTYITEDALDPGLADGRSDWESWFEPFFGLMSAYPQIKGFLYMNHDYRGTHWERTNAWGDARIEANSYILARYLETLREDRFLHRADGLAGTEAMP